MLKNIPSAHWTFISQTVDRPRRIHPKAIAALTLGVYLLRQASKKREFTLRVKLAYL